ncbi:MAG TPA: FtsX-like permease family protein [Polyangiales bacterium]|nr:FtsX-like permease family protein [Polyangiales bacterium]
MSTLRLATRNLQRSPRRTLLTMSAVIAGVGVFILGEGFVSGLTENILVAAIQGTVGHVLARPANYPVQAGQHPVDELLTVTPRARDLLDKESVAWTTRTYFAPTAAAGADALRAVAIGYDPARDEAVFPRDQWKVRGAMPRPNEDAVAVSHRVARLLALEVGSRLILQVRTHQGAMNALDVAVSGITTTSNPALDSLGIFVPGPLAQKLLATDLPSHISVKLRSRAAAVPFAKQLATALGPQASVVTWQDETEELIRIQNVRRRALDLVMAILMALAAFGIVNTVLMAAYERVREIGTLRSLGMTERGVLELFVSEGLLIGLVGSLLGAAWGAGLTYYWSVHPIDFSKTIEQAGGSYSASSLVYTRLSFEVVLITIGLGVLVSAVASIYPARVASRMVPADAVRAI